jgi:hypothetical protein
MQVRDLEAELVNQIAKYKHDWLGFTQFAYPWGEPAGPLANFVGPQHWQATRLIKYAATLKSVGQKGQFATASGKGIGKSALVAQSALAGLCTYPDARGVITAGTETQLRTKTMPEVAKWFQMLICKHWFENPATSIYSSDPGHEKTWRIDAVPWNAANPEASAGLHNLGKRLIVIMDEASQIDNVIWNTMDGVMTDANTEVIWLVFGNPTRSDGRFFRCFGDFRHRWNAESIDSRDVAISDKVKLQEAIDDYGIDSDYVRVFIRGLFPNQSSMQFIANSLVRGAREREALCHLHDPLCLGIDHARYGDDQTVIAVRKGNDARTIPWVKLRNADTYQISGAASELATKYKADAIFVDNGGPNSGGVVDRLRNSGFTVYAVSFGADADRSAGDPNAANYANKRAEIWGYMRDWLEYGALPDDGDLETDLTGVLYTLRDGKKGTEIVLEKKEHMKERGLASPDIGDALALTFAYPLLPRNWAGGPQAVGRQMRQALTEYDPTELGQPEVQRVRHSEWERIGSRSSGW